MASFARSRTDQAGMLPHSPSLPSVSGIACEITKGRGESACV